MPIQNKPKSKKVTEIDPKYIERSEDPNVMISEDPATIQFLLARAENQKNGGYEKQQREHSERIREFNKTLPERQFNMFLSGRHYTVIIAMYR